MNVSSMNRAYWLEAQFTMNGEAEATVYNNYKILLTNVEKKNEKKISIYNPITSHVRITFLATIFSLYQDLKKHFWQILTTTWLFIWNCRPCTSPKVKTRNASLHRIKKTKQVKLKIELTFDLKQPWEKKAQKDVGDWSPVVQPGNHWVVPGDVQSVHENSHGKWI